MEKLFIKFLQILNICCFQPIDNNNETEEILMNINRLSNTNQYATMLAKQTQVQNKSGNSTKETTPLMKNYNADTVEITGITDQEKAELERRAAVDKVSPNEAFMAALVTAPNNEDVERSKELAAKFRPIQAKVLAGRPLTAGEKSFMQKHYPGWLTAMKSAQW